MLTLTRQKEMLFHKIREEQLRRWVLADRTTQDELSRKKPRVAKLVWDQYAYMWEDDDSDQVRRVAGGAHAVNLSL